MPLPGCEFSSTFRTANYFFVLTRCTKIGKHYCVDFFDIFGRELSPHTYITSSSHYKIDISNLSAVFYFYKTKNSVGEVVKKR